MKNIRKWALFAFARSVPKNIRTNFLKDVIAGSLCGLHLGTFTPFFPLISRENLHASEFLIGLMSSGVFVGSLFAMFYSSIVPTNKEMKYYLWVTCLGRGLILTLILAKVALTYCFIIFLLHFIISLGSPQYATMIQRVYPIRYRGALMGYVRLCTALCSLIATLITGAIMKDGEGWRTVFFISGVFALASTFTFGTLNIPLVKEIKKKKESAFKFIISSFAILKENSKNNLMLLSVTFFSIGQLILSTLLPIFQADRLHMTTQNISILTIVQNVAWMIGFPFWGKFIDKNNPIKAWVITCILAAALPLNYFFAHNWTHVAFGHAMNGFFLAGSELAWFNSVLYLSRQGKESKYQALNAFFAGIRGSIGVFGGAFIINICFITEIDIKYIFILSGFLVIASTLLLFKMMNMKKSDFNEEKI